MGNTSDLIVTYLVTLKNKGLANVSEAEVTYYFKSIGIQNAEKELKNLLQNKILLRLKNGKITLNWYKLKKPG